MQVWLGAVFDHDADDADVENGGSDDEVEPFPPSIFAKRSNFDHIGCKMFGVKKFVWTWCGASTSFFPRSARPIKYPQWKHSSNFSLQK